jgi:hypothetical protein
VVEVRSRLFGGRWDSMVFDVQRRMTALNKLFGGAPTDEIHRHIVVSSIAALQTFHRGMVISIIDSDEKYKERAAQSITEKFSMQDALLWLTGKTATFSELAAHLSPCNSVTDMMSSLGTLLDIDIKKTLSEVVDPYAARNAARDARPLVVDVDELLRDLAEAFRLRHIFAHEAAANFVVKADTTERLWASVSTWIDATEAILWATAYAGEPLTQGEMNLRAGAELQSKRGDLAGLLWLALDWARTENKTKWLRSSQRTWSAAVKDWSRSTYGSLEGTIWPGVAASETANTVQARIDQLHGWLTWQNPENRDWANEWFRNREARSQGT